MSFVKKATVSAIGVTAVLVLTAAPADAAEPLAPKYNKLFAENLAPNCTPAIQFGNYGGAYLNLDTRYPTNCVYSITMTLTYVQNGSIRQKTGIVYNNATKSIGQQGSSILCAKVQANTNGSYPAHEWCY